MLEGVNRKLRLL
jgi:hypothetical protein